MRCVSINVVINVDINRWYVFLYNVFWFYIFIMSILENKNVLKLGIV